jgi:predicted dehydrogenase
MTKLRWGILSTSKFAFEKIVPAMRDCKHAVVSAVASRTIEKATEFARTARIERVFDSYEALLEDPDIDVVYNPLPNHLHVPLSISALRAGKHVLCEKPIAMTAAEAQVLLDELKQCPKLKVMEAFMYRFHPQWQRTRELIRDGAIGELRTVQSFFSYFNNDPANIRNRPEIGGGAMLDIGCYCVSLSRFLFESEPHRVTGVMERDPVFGTDRLASGILEFEKGTSVFTCSTQMAPYQRVNIFGTEGRIELEIPFNAPPDRTTRIWLQTRSGTEEITFDICDQYTIQADMFSLAVINDTAVPTPLEDAVANMKVVEKVLGM